MTKLFIQTFKQQCVDLMLKQHHTITQVSKIMSVSTSALQCRTAVSKRTARHHPEQPAITAEQREIQHLRAENEQLRSDNTLLKKVSAFLIDKQ
ncbi:transposase [Aggregatibacter actinomycetemcomitans]|uniref:transposase n=1 Tax=Aggregatibacter actinomycetemcomitans TaxID=714 RepID=UPI001E4FFDF3|nr:transposase [Aggregatibacter actinomycetemcomitans]